MLPMPPFSSVLCAVDLSDLSSQVLYHAAGVAGATGASLTVLTVADHGADDAEAALRSLVDRVIPMGATYLGPPTLRVEPGPPPAAILAAARSFDLLVSGTRGRHGLVRLLLGSTSSVLLEGTTTPILLVPPDDVEIVSLSTAHARLNAGAIIAAVDLLERNDEQLAMASRLAAVARQPLLFLAVVDAAVPEHDALGQLKARAIGLGPASPSGYLVRRGPVAQAIAGAAVTERSGLVVMGIRARDRGRPGAIATAVLGTRRALVLAVPGGSSS
jgi:nucleotide-binding universal stress UspA family protein